MAARSDGGGQMKLALALGVLVVLVLYWFIGLWAQPQVNVVLSTVGS